MHRSLAVLPLLALLVISPFGAHAACPDPVGGWGMAGSGPGQFHTPEAIVQDPNGRWLVADEGNGRVDIFDPVGNFLGQIGSFGYGPGQLAYPCGIAIGPDHRIYVSENQAHRVSVFDLAGNFTHTIGSEGAGPGQLYFPVAVSFSPAGDLYVADYGNNRIDVFRLDGTYVGDLGSYLLNGPYGVRVAPDGSIWVGEYIDGNRVLKFSSGGTLLAAFFGTPGQNFHAPEQVSFDASGNVYVMDTGNDRVCMFDPSMNFVCAFGSTGSGPENLDVPTDGAFDSSGQIFITDYGNNRIRIWGFQPTPANRMTWGEVKARYR